MFRIMMASVVATATGLAGCTSVMGPTPAPSCDGGNRRPLNRSMWDWEAGRPAAPIASVTPPAPASAPSPVEPRTSGEPAIRNGELGKPDSTKTARLPGSPAFDLAESLRPCSSEVGHG